jgi:predicted ester cyclase
MPEPTSEQVLREALAAAAAGRLDELDRYYAPDAVDHGAGDDAPVGLAGIKQGAADFRAAFGELQLVLDHVVAAGDTAAARWRVSAVHTGPFQGIPATGRGVSLTGIDMVRVVGGKIVERWSTADELGLLQQLVDRRAPVGGQPSGPSGRERRRG